MLFAGSPIELPPGVSDGMKQFQYETWLENRAKKAKQESDSDLEEEKVQDQEPAAFSFRPIEEVVAEKANVSGSGSNSVNPTRRKVSDNKGKVYTHTSQSSWTTSSTSKKSIQRTTQSQISNCKPEVYIDYGDDDRLPGYASPEVTLRITDRKLPHHLDSGESHDKSDVHKRKLSSSDDESPSAKDCKKHRW